MKITESSTALNGLTSDVIAWREPGQRVDAAYLRDGALRYAAEDREIVGRNGTCFNNRPLHCEQNSEGAVLVGDRPLARLISKLCAHGALSVAIARDGAGRWLHEYQAVESRYRCGRMMWRCGDPSLPGVGVTLDVVPMEKVAGFAARLRATGLRAGDKLIWAFGGAKFTQDPHLEWDPIMRGNPDICRSGDPRKPLLGFGMVAKWCKGNVASVDNQMFRLSPSAGATRFAVGRLDRAGLLRVADASVCADPVALAASPADQLSMICGTTFPMQTRIANAEFRFRYADGRAEKLELTPPFNFWMLCSWGGSDYSYELDAYCLPKQPPPQVQLGNNCRAMVLSWKLRAGVKLVDVTLETLSQDVVIGLMGVSLSRAKFAAF
ncbi:MAG: DUF4450 domain-containing protein [Verrucomicrobia bacterium]|nr:DUF4450 domain-containing protein [Verrucomicrobiota bacterium]